MLHRRQFLTRALQGSSLVALGGVVPEFLARTARAAEPGRDSVLVVVEMGGGNDGLNTVIPYADELYAKVRPTLKITRDRVVRVNDQVGLHPAMRSLDALLQKGQLAVVQGVGYPNPDRSHFESMDIWQSADPRRKQSTGWLGRSGPQLQAGGGDLPMVHVGPKGLPLALQGAGGGAVSINDKQAYRMDLGGGTADRRQARRQLVEDLAKTEGPDDGLLQFVQRRQLKTMTTLDRLQEVLRDHRESGGNMVFANGRWAQAGSLSTKLQLVAQLIQKGFGTRAFYVTIDGFDTHSGQAETHARLLGEVADGISSFFDTLQKAGHASRVRLMTFSEFGRRVQENGSQGTDHGAASCLFVAGPKLKAGAVGPHPSLSDLDFGDLKHHTDFRRVYATLLDAWLGCDSQVVLGGKFEHVDALKG
jgi:uncharacterized protein (DUF1501 family)